jgi:hypothetical protein
MFLKNGLATVLMLPLVGACADMQNWNWFGQKQSNTKPTTKARRPADEPAVATADRAKSAPKPAADAQADEVDDKVDRYVKSMNNSYDPAYEGNDLQSKMRRQSDPDRAKRVRQTAAMSREPATDSQLPAGARPLPPTAPNGSGGTGNAPRAAPNRSETPPPELDSDDSPPLETETPPVLASPSPSNRSASDVATVPTPAGSAKPNPGKETGYVGSPAHDDPIESAGEGSSPQLPQQKPGAAKPPVLGQVKIAAAPAPESPPPKQVDADRPAANTLPQQVMVDTFKKRLEDQEALVAKDSNNVEEQFRLRLMYLVNGMEEKALALAPGMNADIQDIMQAQLKSLIAARSSAQRDPAAWANKQLAAVEELRSLVRARADLGVPRVLLCKAIDGFGRYTPFEPAEFQAGKPNRVLLYVEVDNFSTERTSSGQFRVLLTMRQSLLTKSGEEIWSAKDDNIEDLSRQRRRDFYLTAERVIPKTLNPGDYVFKVEIEDVLAGKINGASVTFKLVP